PLLSPPLSFPQSHQLFTTSEVSSIPFCPFHNGRLWLSSFPCHRPHLLPSPRSRELHGRAQSFHGLPSLLRRSSQVYGQKEESAGNRESDIREGAPGRPLYGAVSPPLQSSLLSTGYSGCGTFPSIGNCRRPQTASDSEWTRRPHHRAGFRPVACIDQGGLHRSPPRCTLLRSLAVRAVATQFDHHQAHHPNPLSIFNPSIISIGSHAKRLDLDLLGETGLSDPAAFISDLYSSPIVHVTLDDRARLFFGIDNTSWENFLNQKLTIGELQYVDAGSMAGLETEAPMRDFPPHVFIPYLEWKKVE
ncbi:hypothetical protein PMAYCL1PPCAC_03288, partial [Pristionchus mayeri]